MQSSLQQLREQHDRQTLDLEFQLTRLRALRKDTTMLEALLRGEHASFAQQVRDRVAWDKAERARALREKEKREREGLLY